MVGGLRWFGWVGQGKRGGSSVAVAKPWERFRGRGVERASQPHCQCSSNSVFPLRLLVWSRRAGGDCGQERTSRGEARDVQWERSKEPKAATSSAVVVVVGSNRNNRCIIGCPQVTDNNSFVAKSLRAGLHFLNPLSVGEGFRSMQACTLETCFSHHTGPPTRSPKCGHLSSCLRRKQSSRLLIPQKQRSLFSYLDVSDEPSSSSSPTIKFPSMTRGLWRLIVLVSILLLESWASVVMDPRRPLS